MTIALFLTEKTSFAVWERAGFFSRGVLNYNALAAHCDQFYFVTYGSAAELAYQKFFAHNCIILYKSYAWMPLRLYGFLSPFIHRRALRRADVFYSGQMQGAWSAIIARYLFQKKFVLNCGYQWSFFSRAGNEAFIKRFLIYSIEWIAYHAAHHIIVSSAWASPYVARRYGIDQKKIDVIPNYIDTDFFHPPDTACRERRIVFIGRLERQKNLDILFDAVRGSALHLTIVGTGSLEHHLQERARAENISVVFKGIIPNSDLPALLGAHAAFVSPSLYEGSPKALLEGMACALPVVACDAPGMRDVIVHGVSGILCAPTSGAFRAALDQLFSDFDRARALGQRARAYVIEHCNLDRKIEREMAIFNLVCNQ